jgi:hypothetical protein
MNKILKNHQEVIMIIVLDINIYNYKILNLLMKIYYQEKKEI